MTRRIVIDTDPGIDDAMAIFYALGSPEVEVVGLTTVFGNSDVDTCTTNAARLLEIAGRPDIPVARGAAVPLVAQPRPHADFVHGRDGQGDTFLPPPSVRPVDVGAATFIVDTVMAAPGEITLVPIGPLTNVATALRLEPRLSQALAGIVLMGGNAFCGGNASAAAEANILNDPEAADIVFASDCPVTMVGLDVTHRIRMDLDDVARIAAIDTPSARHLSAILPTYVDFHRRRNGIDGFHVHDSTAISVLVAPEHFEVVEAPVCVDVGHSVARGRTVAFLGESDDLGPDSPFAGRRPARIVTGADQRAVVEMELDRLAGSP